MTDYELRFKCNQRNFRAMVDPLYVRFKDNQEKFLDHRDIYNMELYMTIGEGTMDTTPIKITKK